MVKQRVGPSHSIPTRRHRRQPQARIRKQIVYESSESIRKQNTKAEGVDVDLYGVAWRITDPHIDKRMVAVAVFVQNRSFLTESLKRIPVQGVGCEGE